MTQENEDLEQAHTMSGLPNIRPLEPGRRLKLRDDSLVEVVWNPHDGMWIRAKYIECPEDSSLEGSEELIFTQDVAEILEVR